MYHKLKPMLKHPKISLLVILLLVVAGYVSFCMFRTLPVVKATPNKDLFQPIATGPQISWPSSGQSAVGVLGTKILDSHGDTQASAPTASTAKLITALMVLRLHPLQPGQQGPTITLTQADVDIYNQYIAEDGSVVNVQAGEQISEYQMLAAMLIPSANNIADSLADWAYGSLPNYEEAASKFLVAQGLSGTRVGSDASGFLPDSVSTAPDLVKIGEMVMQNPILPGIVDQSSATGIPVVGTITNYDNLLGSNNIVGIKTGNNDQDAGVFVGASKSDVGGQTVTIVTAYMQAASLQEALSSSLPLLTSSQANYQEYTMISSGQQVASFRLPWQKQSTPVIASTNLDAYAWGGGEVDNSVNFNKITYPTDSGKVVGQAVVTGDASLVKQTANLTLGGELNKPSFVWRVLHP
jgi:D-alanyl-D-alanine carboxypeptidase (penicillin-binding protein 5/6)